MSNKSRNNKNSRNISPTIYISIRTKHFCVIINQYQEYPFSICEYAMFVSYVFYSYIVYIKKSLKKVYFCNYPSL